MIPSPPTYDPTTTMSQSTFDDSSSIIPGTRLSMFDRAPIEMGCKRDYFKDEATRALLGLNKGDFMQNLGTYGAKEMGMNPVNFDLLHDGTYDQRFLPFIPCLQGPLIVRYLDMQLVNRQWLPSPTALRGL